MRLSESDIKAAILHPEEHVRLTGLAYFSDSYTTDESVMSIVIEAVEKYGRETSFRMMRDADRLPQTEFSFNWLLSELQANFDLTDIKQDNHRFAVCLVLLAAPLEMLAERQEEIAASPNFAPELRPALDELVTMASWDWKTGWTKFNEFVSGMRGKSATIDDHHRQARLIRGLSHMRHEGADQILSLLTGNYRGTDRVLMEWADPWIVELAGEMQTKQAIALIFDRVSEGDETVIDECGPALARIGGEDVVRAIAADWWESDEEFRSVAAEALEHIHTDLSVESCLEFLSAEEDFDIGLMLGHAVLSHFTVGHIDTVRELVAGADDDLEPDQWDLRYKLIATATITGERFSEYDAWHREAVESNYGQGRYERTRIADNFQPDLQHLREPEPDVPSTPTRKKISRNDTCPCGSGKKYKKCCIDKGFDWVEDDDGNVFKSVPMSGEMVDLLDDQREAFITANGREPGPDDLVFPDMPHPEHVEHQMVEAMKEAGINPAQIYAFEKTGRLVTEKNQNLLSDEELDEWEAAIDEYEAANGSEEAPEYPIGTIALYGPDDTRTTKIVASVIIDRDAEPILERWVGSDVMENPKYQQAIGAFFDKHDVKSVAASEGNMGCPHEEGEDFPIGEDCPFCPFWEGKQGSGAEF